MATQGYVELLAIQRGGVQRANEHFLTVLNALFAESPLNWSKEGSMVLKAAFQLIELMPLNPAHKLVFDLTLARCEHYCPELLVKYSVEVEQCQLMLQPPRDLEEKCLQLLASV